jgi:arsenate reductase (glutaredoxin)
MKKIYYLSTCSTCKQILSSTKALTKDFLLQDIKTQKISAEQLKEMKKMAGSYEALFSRRAQKYTERGLKNKKLTEDDYCRLILDEYSFLKRPVAIVQNKIFVGSDLKTQAAFLSELGQ